MSVSKLVKIVNGLNFYDCPICLVPYQPKTKQPMVVCPAQHTCCLPCVEDIVFKRNTLTQAQCFLCREKIFKNQVSEFRLYRQICETQAQMKVEGSKIKKNLKDMQSDKELLHEQLLKQQEKVKWLIQQHESYKQRQNMNESLMKLVESKLKQQFSSFRQEISQDIKNQSKTNTDIFISIKELITKLEKSNKDDSFNELKKTIEKKENHSELLKKIGDLITSENKIIKQQIKNQQKVSIDNLYKKLKEDNMKDNNKNQFQKKNNSKNKVQKKESQKQIIPPKTISKEKKIQATKSVPFQKKQEIIPILNEEVIKYVSTANERQKLKSENKKNKEPVKKYQIIPKKQEIISKYQAYQLKKDQYLSPKNIKYEPFKRRQSMTNLHQNPFDLKLDINNWTTSPKRLMTEADQQMHPKLLSERKDFTKRQRVKSIGMLTKPIYENQPKKEQSIKEKNVIKQLTELFGQKATDQYKQFYQQNAKENQEKIIDLYLQKKIKQEKGQQKKKDSTKK